MLGKSDSLSLAGAGAMVTLSASAQMMVIRILIRDGVSTDSRPSHVSPLCPLQRGQCQKSVRVIVSQSEASSVSDLTNQRPVPASLSMSAFPILCACPPQSQAEYTMYYVLLNDLY